MGKPAIQQSMKMILRERELYRLKHGKTEEEKQAELLEKAQRKAASYEKQKERQRQHRAELGLKRGRPFKNEATMEQRVMQIQQLLEMEKLEKNGFTSL